MKISKTFTYIGILMIMLCICRCQPPKHVEKPKDLIEKAQFIDLLTEIEIMDAAIKVKTLPDSVKKLGYKAWFSALLDNFNTDTVALKNTFIYYSHYPKKMSAIYQKVADRIEKKGDAFYKKAIVDSSKKRKS